MKTVQLLFLCTLLAMSISPSIAAPVQINSASAEELSESLTGIGLKKAQAIVEYREQHGSFRVLEDLLNVKGIGESLLKKIADDVVLE